MHQSACEIRVVAIRWVKERVIELRQDASEGVERFECARIMPESAPCLREIFRWAGSFDESIDGGKR
jgi:hypothetical protein